MGLVFVSVPIPFLLSWSAAATAVAAAAAGASKTPCYRLRPRAACCARVHTLAKKNETTISQMTSLVIALNACSTEHAHTQRTLQSAHGTGSEGQLCWPVPVVLLSAWGLQARAEPGAGLQCSACLTLLLPRTCANVSVFVASVTVTAMKAHAPTGSGASTRPRMVVTKMDRRLHPCTGEVT